jgi:hypothetical protein
LPPPRSRPGAVIVRAVIVPIAVPNPEVVMFAIQKLEDYLRSSATPAAARELTRLLEALKQEAEYPLSSLYEIDFEAFELAVEALRDWRIDRYYAGPAAAARADGVDAQEAAAA